MTATITLIADNQTAGGFQEIVNQANAVEHELSDAEREAQDLRKELENRAAQAYAQRIKGLADEFSRLEDEADKAGDQISRIQNMGSSTASKITAISTATLAGFEAFKKMGEWARWGWQQVQVLADQGNPAMVELVGAVDELVLAGRDFFEDPVIQEWASDLAQVIREDLSPALRSIPGEWRSIQDSIGGTITATGEWLGLMEEGTSQTLEQMHQLRDEMIEQERLRIEQAKRQAQVAKQQEQATKFLQDLERGRAMASYQQFARSIDNQQELNHELQKSIRELERLAKVEGISTEELQEQQRKILALEAQRDRVITEQEKKRQAAVREQMEAYKEQQEQARRTTEAQAKLEEAYRKKQAAEHKAHLDARMAVWRDHVDKIKQLLEGEEGQQQNKAQQLLKQQDQRAVLDQIVKNRAAQDPRLREADTVGERRRAEREIRKEAFRDMRSGELGAGEVAQAQNQLAQNVIRSARGNGRLGQAQAQALSEAVKVLTDQAAEQERLAAEVEQIGKFIRGVGQNQRSRLQRGGGRA